MCSCKMCCYYTKLALLNHCSCLTVLVSPPDSVSYSVPCIVLFFYISTSTLEFLHSDNSPKLSFRRNLIIPFYSGTNGSIPPINVCNYVVRSEGHIVGPREAQWETCQLDPCDWLSGGRKCRGRGPVQECVGRGGLSTAQLGFSTSAFVSPFKTLNHLSLSAKLTTSFNRVTIYHLYFLIKLDLCLCCSVKIPVCVFL